MMLKKATPFYNYSYFPDEIGMEGALVMMHSSIHLGEEEHWAKMWNARLVSALGSYDEARKAKNHASEVFYMSHPLKSRGLTRPRSIHEGP